MNLYHGTSLENAKKIEEEGFKVVPSYEMALGMGAYFTQSFESAQKYAQQWDRFKQKGIVLSFNLPVDAKVCPINNSQGIGTFYQNYDGWCRDQIIGEIAEKQGVDVEDADYSDGEVEEECFELYKEDAAIFTDDYFEKDGCQAVCSETQCVIHDPNIIRTIKGDNITLIS